MAKMTPEQEAQLADLEKLRDAPDEGGGGGRDLSIIIDLGDDKAVKRALALGVLEKGDLDEFDAPGGEGEDEGGKKGGKGEGEGEGEGEGGPKRRLSIADKTMGSE